MEWHISQKPQWQPIDYDQFTIDMNYPQTVNCLDIINQVSQDATIYYAIELLTENIIQRRGSSFKVYFPEKQMLTIARTLLEVIEKKLPDTRNIAHEGWIILCLAQLARLRSITANTYTLRSDTWDGFPSWADILTMAESIENTADKVFVLVECGYLSYHINVNLGTSFLEKAKYYIDHIPNVVDRADRYYQLASTWNKVDNSEATKLFLQEAISFLTLGLWDQTRDKLAGQILELAHSIDPDFASYLATKVDNPITKDKVKQRFASENLKKKPGSLRKYESEIEKVIRQAAYKLMRTSCSLNVQTSEEDLRTWLYIGLRGDFNTAGWIGAWYLDQTLKRKKALKVSNLTDWWSGMMEWLDLSQQVAGCLSGIRPIGVAPVAASTLPNRVFFEAGQKKDAIEYLLSWISKPDHEYLRIYEAYFSIEELFILQHVAPGTRVWILTSWKGQKGLTPGTPEVEEVYRKAWQNITKSSQPTLEVYVHVFGLKSGKSGPIHDRYIVGSKEGIELGTSINGLDNETSFKLLDKTEKEAIEKNHIQKLLLDPPKKHKDEPVLIRSFTL